MPELSKHNRGAGAKTVDGLVLRRCYTRANVGPPCDVCAFPLVIQLSEAGETTHPTCSGEFEDLIDALRRTLARRDAHGASSAGVNGAHHKRDLPPKSDQDPGNRGGARPAPVDTPLPDPVDAPRSSPGTMSGAQRGMLFAMFAATGMTDRALRLEFCTDTVHRPITSTAELSHNETRQVIDALVRIEKGADA